jgi:hypothetical protein
MGEIFFGVGTSGTLSVRSVPVLFAWRSVGRGRRCPSPPARGHWGRPGGGGAWRARAPHPPPRLPTGFRIISPCKEKKYASRYQDMLIQRWKIAFTHHMFFDCLSLRRKVRLLESAIIALPPRRFGSNLLRFQVLSSDTPFAKSSTSAIDLVSHYLNWPFLIRANCDKSL